VLDAQVVKSLRAVPGAPQRRHCYEETETAPKTMGAASRKLFRFVPRVTTTYQVADPPDWYDSEDA
jgi:hypothetical protein